MKKASLEKFKMLNPPQQDWINKHNVSDINIVNVLWKEYKINPKDTKKENDFIEKRNEVNYKKNNNIISYSIIVRKI